nr:U5 small nuclear ribonucleoprotein 200 kDa [Seculamonas ecuadoriensis]
MSGGGEYSQFRQYEFRANHALVLQSENRPRGGDGEASGESKTLKGRVAGRMGDRAMMRERPKEVEDRLERKRRREQTASSSGGISVNDLEASSRNLPRKKRKGALGNVLEALDELDASSYRPKSEATQQVYETLLSFVQVLLGDKPQDVLRNVVDEMLTTLKTEGLREPEKKRNIEEFMGPISDDTFNKLTNLSKRITDFKLGSDMGEDTLDDKLGVNVVIGDEEDEQEDNQLDVIQDEDEDEEDEDAEERRLGDESDDENVLLAKGDFEGAMDVDERRRRDPNRVDASAIDAYWLQRKVASFFTDANVAQRMAEEVLDALADDDERDCETKLVTLLEFERFDLIKLLLRNRRKILYCTRLARAPNEQAYAAISDEMRRDPELAMILNERENGPSAAGGAGAASQKDAASARARAQAAAEVEPNAAKSKHVLDLEALSFEAAGHFMSNRKCKLPEGSYRTSKKGYEEVHVPGARAPPMSEADRLVDITTMPSWTHDAFAGVKRLNRMQSKMYEAAFHGSENVLLCAPTGAGKTNVAMLSMLHEIGLHRLRDGSIDLSAFKIVYVAPMKALVQEVVQNFGNRLKNYGITVRELTGDQQLTKQQISETQIIVTTPEKWDIVTRKSGDRTYTQLVKLLIIDEIHLLHDSRGPVLECLVARTLRQVETTQEMVRIVGLSATLPNYADVAAFLRVNVETGLFHFDASYRPVPLTQQYIGISERKALKRMQLMDQITYEKVMEQAGKNQVLVFVHSRKETAKTARAIRDTALERDTLGAFLSEDSASREILATEAENVKDLHCKDLLPYGFATHHAGMNRDDRNLVEDLFAAGHVKVLVSTATLAWGVNLPAHTVIIKGTQVYNPEKGRWCELSPLDVMQMMGRAGRPQFDTEGEGIIITTQAELQYYLSLLNQQLPIESQFVSKLADNLNAEIVMGTVQNAREAVQWLGYTYLYVRMLRNPSLYGITEEEAARDPSLELRRADLVHTAALVLDRTNLIKYDKKSGNFQVTDLGRVASHYYIAYQSMAVYNEHLKPTMSDIDLMRLFSLSNEFKYITVREEEKLELAKLLEKVPIPVKESLEEPTAKVNVLLQSFISGLRLDGFALAADMVYVQQSAGRIVRALCEVVMMRNWFPLTYALLTLAKSIEHRQWSSQCPLGQFKAIPAELLRKLDKKDITWDRYLEMSAQEIGELVRLPAAGKGLYKFVHKLPKLDVSAQVQPIARSMLLVEVTLTPDFQWDEKIHGNAEPFHIFALDADSELILHHEIFLLKRDHATEESYVSFTVPVSEPIPPQYFVRVVSDRWLGSETLQPISFRHLILPEKNPPHTELIDLLPLPLSALRAPHFEPLFAQSSSLQSSAVSSVSIRQFNPIQTQCFASLYASDSNVLVCAPAGSGKTVCAELAMLRLMGKLEKEREAGDKSPDRIVYIAPTDAIANVRFDDWDARFGRLLGKRVVKLTGEGSVDLKLLEVGDIVVSSAEKFDALSRRWNVRKGVQAVRLLVCDELHMIGGMHGPTYEVVVSRMRSMAHQLETGLRIVGLSTSLANARDMGEWMGVPSNCLFNFHPNVRPIPLEMRIQAFDQPTFRARMLAMSKPMYLAIKYSAVDKPVMVFVPSRKQTRVTALELLSFVAGEENTKRFVHAAESDLDVYLQAVEDSTLQQTLEYGVAYLHEGLSKNDAQIVNQLYSAGAVQILILNYSMCWSTPLSTHMVVIMGTQFYDGREHRYVDYPVTDVLQMMGRAARPLEDDSGKCFLFCHGPRKDYYKKFTYEPLPVESHLDRFLADHMNAEIVSRVVENKQAAVDYLTWTFLYRRITQNPNYYNLQGVSHQHVSDYLSELIESVIGNLESSKCIAVEDDMDLMPLNLGMIASYYYIKYTTVELFGSSLTSKTKLRGLVEILSSASEFDSLIIRKKEDQLLGKLAAHLPLKIDKRFSDPHAKCNVLLQSHFSRSKLSADLSEDLVEVLPMATRLLSATVDVVASNGWLNPALAAMELSQMVVQGLWNKDPILKQLPHFSDEMIERCKAAGVETIFDVTNLEDEDRARLLGSLSDKQLADVARVCNMYPNVEVTYGIMNDSVNVGGKVTVGVELEREDEDPYIGPVYAPRYPTSKDEVWWVVVGDTRTNVLHANKRVTIGAKKTRVKLEFDAPAQPGDYQFTLFLMSDSYLGCDQEFEIEFNVEPADAEAMEE